MSHSAPLRHSIGVRVVAWERTAGNAGVAEVIPHFTPIFLGGKNGTSSTTSGSRAGGLAGFGLAVGVIIAGAAGASASGYGGYGGYGGYHNG